MNLSLHRWDSTPAGHNQFKNHVVTVIGQQKPITTYVLGVIVRANLSPISFTESPNLTINKRPPSLQVLEFHHHPQQHLSTTSQVPSTTYTTEHIKHTTFQSNSSYLQLQSKLTSHKSQPSTTKFSTSFNTTCTQAATEAATEDTGPGPTTIGIAVRITYVLWELPFCIGNTDTFSKVRSQE